MARTEEIASRASSENPGESVTVDAPAAAAPGSMLATVGAHLPPGVLQRKLARRAVQRAATAAAPDESAITAAAGDGVATPSGALPHLDQIQRSFGRHDVSGIHSHTGDRATAAANSMQAEAFATGDHVVFGGAPSLNTAAHEAAHVVQQRAGVHLAGGVGREGDAYEQHADAVADKVVRGESAETLLDKMAPSGTGAGSGGVQRKVAKSAQAGRGPIADIEDSAFGGTAKARADEALALVEAGTAFDAHPWVAARASANGGKVPNSVKKNFKWKWPHRNNDGHLPGVPGAGGYDEYYIMNVANDGPAEAERLVVAADGNVFHTATHYGDRGAPAFTHFKAK